MDTNLTIALISIARPTFDVPLAQSVADAVLTQLTDAGCDVVGTSNELLMDADGADRAIASLTDADFDLLILLQASFADSSMAVQVAKAVQDKGAPTLLWAVPDERTGGRLRLNSLCGINLAAHAMMQQGIAYDYLLTDAADVSAMTKVEQLARAGRARRVLQNARVGVVGDYPAGFDTCAYVPEDLQTLFGATVVPLSLDSTLEQAAVAKGDDASLPTRTAFVEQVRTHAANLDELDQEALNGTASVYATLRNTTSEHQLDGVAVRCWPEFFTELGCAACGAMGMLNEEMCPASCEADVNGTVTSLLLQAVSGSQAFITDLVSIDAENDTGVLWHCGLAPVSMADPEGEIVGTVHSNRKLPLLLEFPLKPGRITIARLHRAQLDNGTAGYQLVIGSGEMVRAPKSYGGTSGVVRFDRAATEVFDTVMRKGLEHHFCITYGDYADALRSFAGLAGLDVIELT
ncbi:MAG: fucose isomerase [Chloroflexota bacterium]